MPNIPTPPRSTMKPMDWLWSELHRRYGPRFTEELRRGFKEQARRYDEYKRAQSAMKQELSSNTP